MSSSPPVQPVVLKFGGTSVRDAAAMRRVVAIVESERGRAPVVVTSACAGVTDALLACARFCGESRLEEALAIVSELRSRHHEIRRDLAADDAECEAALASMLDEIERLVQGVIMLGELTPRTTDLFGSFGERLASILLATAFRKAGWRTALTDSRRFIITDECFTDARPLMDAIDRNAPAELMPLLERNEVVIAQGFIGSTTEGVTTTIGRGGSDHTAALVGAALGAREIQIWTDVSGILTADPRLVPAARVVPEVTFTEARELAYFGAKVIHPDTILPAVARAIPVVIKNSMRPEDPGTRILPDGSTIPPGIHSITIKRGMSVLELSPRDPREGPAPVARALALFADNDIPLHCALLAETRAIATVETAMFDDIILASLESSCHVKVSHAMALLCLTGAALRQTPAALAGPLAALEGIPVAFVGAGSSEHILLVAVPESGAAEALAAVHARLFE